MFSPDSHKWSCSQATCELNTMVGSSGWQIPVKCPGGQNFAIKPFLCTNLNCLHLHSWCMGINFNFLTWGIYLFETPQHCNFKTRLSILWRHLSAKTLKFKILKPETPKELQVVKSCKVSAQTDKNCKSSFVLIGCGLLSAWRERTFLWSNSGLMIYFEEYNYGLIGILWDRGRSALCTITSKYPATFPGVSVFVFVF